MTNYRREKPKLKRLCLYSECPAISLHSKCGTGSLGMVVLCNSVSQTLRQISTDIYLIAEKTMQSIHPWGNVRGRA